jgi:nucleoside-specific outer membrane channel protein Tsx
VKKAHAKAGMMIGMGFLGCVTQLSGLGVNIYVIYDWNEIEPVTWMLCKNLSAYLFRIVLHDGWQYVLHQVSC